MYRSLIQGLDAKGKMKLNQFETALSLNIRKTLSRTKQELCFETMPYQSWSLIIFNVPIYGWLFHLIWVQLLTQIAAGEIRGNSGVKSWASLSWPETQTEGSI